MLALVVLIAFALSIIPSDAAAPVTVLAQLLSMLFCTGCTVWMLRRVEPGRARWAWGIIALAQCLYAAGDIVLIILATSPDASPTSVSLADVFFLPLAPLTAVGVVLFPAARSSLAKQVRIILDASIAVGALLGLALVFLIAPHAVSGTSTDLIFIAYPVTDLTLLLALVVLLARGIENYYRPVIFFFIVGMVVLLWSDSAYNYLSLPGLGGESYHPGLFYVDPGWVAAAFAFSLAPLTLLYLRRHPGASWAWLDRLSVPITLRASTLSQFLLLVAPVGVLIGLLTYINFHPEQHGTNLPLLVLTSLVFLLIISRQILTQRDLGDARTATERARQLDELKDQFITSVNHELRTPLMTMQGYIELLTDEDVRATPAKQAEMVERAQRAGTNLVLLVKSILDTRRIEDEARDLVPEVVMVRQAVEASLSLVDPVEAEPNRRSLDIQVPAQLTVWGDPVRIQQILTNLLSNSLKYSPPTAPIQLSARLVVSRGTGFLGLKTNGRLPASMVEISVQDRGLGIPPEQQELLFRRFVRLPREIASSIHGTGLGLYLCRTFVEAMGGTIWVESTGIPGEGSKFTLRLPCPPAERLVSSPQPGEVSKVRA
jgi:signal transduction histidine kinase